MNIFKIIKLLIITLLFSIITSQESGFFHSNKKSAVILSVSMLNNLNQEENLNSSTYSSLKLDYKLKNPLELWIKYLNDSDHDLYIGSFGLAYLLDTKKSKEEEQKSANCVII